ncbi:MAG TPA: DUF4397 domain-containing protein [Gemmatimonadales bacterium]|nr:DUF4397 domain-containing protein [Gemmatimonadales bacterium]
MRFRLLAAGLAALVLQGCGHNGTAPESGDGARITFASASPDAGALDLLVYGRTIARGVGSTTASQAAEVDPGQTTGEVRATSSAAVLATISLALEAGKSYTVLVAGPRQALTALVSVDTGSSGPLPPPPPREPVDSGNPPPQTVDYARFRIVHAAPHAPPLDPYLQPSNAPLDTTPAFLPFAYGSLALIADLIRPAGNYTVAFTEAGTRRVVLDSGIIEAAIGDLLTVVLGENADRSLRVDVVRE